MWVAILARCRTVGWTRGWGHLPDSLCKKSKSRGWGFFFVFCLFFSQRSEIPSYYLLFEYRTIVPHLHTSISHPHFCHNVKNIECQWIHSVCYDLIQDGQLGITSALPIRNHFILVRVVVDLEPLWGTPATRCEDTLDGTRTHSHSHSPLE